MQRSSFQHRNTGFSLVELMVGVVVALAAALVVTEIFKVSEGQRRATTGGDDAQTTGAIAISLLQRDLRQAGQGFSTMNLLGCTLNLGNSRSMDNLSPVAINPAGVPAGDDDTDILVVGYGAGAGVPEGTFINSQPGAAIYSVAADQAFQANDRVIAAPATRAAAPAACTLDLTTVSIAPVASNVTVALGMANASGGTLYNLGRQPRFVAYAVRSSQLTMCDFLTQNCTSSDPANWTQVADGIVSLRAEYARDTTAPRDAIVDQYDQTSPTTACGWSRVVGLRLVVVARSRQPEKANVPASAPSWAGAAALTLSTVNADWALYRYKTFETTLPLRNIPDATDPNFAACP